MLLQISAVMLSACVFMACLMLMQDFEPLLWPLHDSCLPEVVEWAGAHLYKLAVDQKERNYPIWVKGVWNFIVSFIKFLQWLKVPLRSFTPNKLYIIDCVLCCRKIHSWNVKPFSSWPALAVPISPCLLTKLLTSLTITDRSLAQKRQKPAPIWISVFSHLVVWAAD